MQPKVSPHTTIPAEDVRDHFTLKVVWDKLGSKLNASAAICFVMALNHQNCVCIQKMAYP